MALAPSIVVPTADPRTTKFMPELREALTAVNAIGTRNGIAVTSTDGFVLDNTTLATAAIPLQYSPRLHWTAQGWKTNATAASQRVDAWAELIPVQGAANPTSYLSVKSQINSGAIVEPLQLHSSGSVVVPTGNLGVGTGATLPAHKLVVGLITEQNTARIYGHADANKPPVLSLFRTGNREMVMAGTPSLLVLANTGGLANYQDATINAAAQLAITNTGSIGIGPTVPETKVHVWGRILADPQAFITTASGNLPAAAIGYYGNPGAGGGVSFGMYSCMRQNLTLPGDGGVANAIAFYASIENLNGRGDSGEIWGGDIVCQIIDVASGGSVTGARALEIEIGTEIATIDDPMGGWGAGLARANALEILSVGGHTFQPNSAIAIYTNGTDASNRFKAGIYVSRVATYGLWFDERAGDTGNLFSHSLIFANAPTACVLKGGVKTVTNGIDLSPMTISGNAFKSPGFHVTGLGYMGLGTATGSATFILNIRQDVAGQANFQIQNATAAGEATIRATANGGTFITQAATGSSYATPYGEIVAGVGYLYCSKTMVLMADGSGIFKFAPAGNAANRNK